MIWMFDVLLHPMAVKSLKKMDKETCRQIKKKMNELKKFPEERGKHLRYTQFWTLRVGDYRVIYEIKTIEKKVTILFIGHRDNVYYDFSKLY